MTGPYIYALYESYGYTIDDIGTLFVAGFGSSLVFGTVIGSLGDRFGRRLAKALSQVVIEAAFVPTLIGAIHELVAEYPLALVFP